MTRAIVTISFMIYDEFNGELYLSKNDVIEYERYTSYDAATMGPRTRMRIFYFDTKLWYDIPDFIIEGYVTTIPQPLLNYQSDKKDKCFQIQKFDSVHNTNKFLKNIPKENVIEIKPLENNTYLVTYSEEMK